MNHLGTQTIETARLILRRFERTDAEAMYRNWASDDAVTEFLMWPAHSSVAVSEEVLNMWIPQYEKPGFYQWAIVLKSIDEPIGSISIVQQRDELEMVHIGYCIGKAWWNQGITSEALAALVKFFFEEVGVNRIESRHDLRNPNSGKVMTKCGLRYEGTMRQGDWCNQGICDCAMYGMLAEDYLGAAQA